MLPDSSDIYGEEPTTVKPRVLIRSILDSARLMPCLCVKLNLTTWHPLTPSQEGSGIPQKRGRPDAFLVSGVAVRLVKGTHFHRAATRGRCLLTPPHRLLQGRHFENPKPVDILFGL